MDTLFALEDWDCHPLRHLFQAKSIDVAVYLIATTFCIFGVLLLNNHIHEACDCLIIQLNLVYPRNNHTPSVDHNIRNRLLLKTFKRKVFLQNHRFIGDNEMIQFYRAIKKTNHNDNLLLFELLMLDDHRMQLDTCYLVDLAIDDFELALIS